jgi:hypothetical protein
LGLEGLKTFERLIGLPKSSLPQLILTRYVPFGFCEMLAITAPLVCNFYQKNPPFWCYDLYHFSVNTFDYFAPIFAPLLHHKLLLPLKSTKNNKKERKIVHFPLFCWSE